MKYTYIDYTKGDLIFVSMAKDSRRPFEVRTGEIIFECEAPNILEADKLMQSATNIDPVKHTEISCSTDGAKWTQHWKKWVQ